MANQNLKKIVALEEILTKVQNSTGTSFLHAVELLDIRELDLYNDIKEAINNQAVILIKDRIKQLKEDVKK